MIQIIISISCRIVQAGELQLEILILTLITSRIDFGIIIEIIINKVILTSFRVIQEIVNYTTSNPMFFNLVILILT